MRATVNGQRFVRSVGLCGHVLPSRSGAGRRGEVILRTVGSELQCSADNGTFTISSSIDASVEQEGCISVPAEILTGFAAAVDEIEDVALNYNATTSELHLACASFDPRIRCSGDATPPLEVAAADAAIAIDLDAAEFLAGVRSVVFAASKEDHRPVLTGVQISIGAGSVELTATDGHRVAWRQLKGIATAGVQRSAIIPAATLDEALSAIDLSQSKLTLAFDRDGRRIQLGNDRTKLVTRLIDGDFPSVDPLRGLIGKAVITVTAHELANKVRTTAVWARAGDHVVRLYTADALTLTASTRDVGDIRTLVNGKCVGESTRVALNSQFLLDCCAAAPESTLDLQIIDDNSPATIRHLGSDEYEYVIMSVKLSDW
jgi:DNA polymerase III subunit beta